MSFHIYTSSGSGRYDCSYADSLSTNLFSVEADSNDRFADRAFNFNDPLYCLRVRIKQPFIFTTWTSHMHFLHIFSPPARGQPKGNVKLTVDDCFIFLCTVFRDLVPMVAINIVYRTCVLLSIIFALPRKSWRSFILLNLHLTFIPISFIPQVMFQTIIRSYIRIHRFMSIGMRYPCFPIFLLYCFRIFTTHHLSKRFFDAFFRQL